MHLRVNPMKKIFSGVFSLGLLLLAISNQAQASNNNFYTVELIIFSNDLRMYQEEESWPLPKTLDIADELLFLKDLPIDAVYPELSPQGIVEAADIPSRFLPIVANDDKDLSFAAERIRLAGRHSLLLHKTWLQKIYNEDMAKDIAILAGEERNGYYEVSGSIRLHLGRYLHINTNLWRILFADENTEQTIDEGEDRPAIELPLIREEALPVLADDIALQQPTINSHTLDTEELYVQDVEKSQQPAISLIATLQQKRRMRSREVHYIDHPLFGLLIELRPYQPETLDE